MGRRCDRGHGNWCPCMKYGAHIDGYAALKDSDGFRFNVYLWQTKTIHVNDSYAIVDDETVLDLYVKGLRVKNNLIHLPAMGSRLSIYPTVFLPRPWALAVVGAITTDKKLRAEFPGCFPLLSDAILTENLMFAPRDMVRDFPALAQARGMMGN